MKYSEIKDKSASELVAMDGDIRRELFNMRFQKANNELQDTSKKRKKRKELARVNTALTAQQKQAKK